MLIDALRKEWIKKNDRGWDRLYIAVDLHDTLVASNYDGLAQNFYPQGIDCLKMLSQRDDIVLILWTSSYGKDSMAYTMKLKEYGIDIKYINCNPLEENTKTGDFSRKFYFNILLDDKAGFVAETDWDVVHKFFTEHEGRL